MYEELVAIREVCDEYHNICLKTILATGELFNLKHVYKVSMVAMMAGADFIKTSTGKEAINATLPVGIIMCRAIKDFKANTGKMVCVIIYTNNNDSYNLLFLLTYFISCIFRLVLNLPVVSRLHRML